MKKRIVSVFVMFTLLVTALVTPAVASTVPQTVQIGGTTLIITQTVKNGVKTVIVNDGQNISTVVYNGKTANVVTKDLNGKTTDTKSVNMASLPKTTAVTTQIATVQTTVTDPGYIVLSNADVWWGYQYAVRQFNYSPSRWWLKLDTGAQKTIYENSSNLTNLRGYEQWVDTMTRDEFACIASGGTAVASALAGFLSAPGTFGLSAVVAFAIAVGGTFTAGYYGYWAWYDSGKCDYYFGICR